MAEWPEHGRVARVWQARVRAPGREDRLFRDYEATLPPLIADRDYSVPSPLQADLDAGALAILGVDARWGEQLSSLSSLLVRSETVASSKIELVDASLEDYARAEGGGRSNASATAMVAGSRAIEALLASVDSSGAITRAALLNSHRILMSDDPIDGAHAGTVRSMQNWIGGSDYTPRDAVHVPPPEDTVDAYLDDLLAYAARTDMHPLVQAAIVHAQFESIHPFTDGSGRIGRALIAAVLRRRGLTKRTVAPLAAAMRARRAEYFDLVNAYRDGAVTPFVSLLARSAQVAGEESAVAAAELADLPARWVERVRPRSRSGSAVLIGELLSHPVLTADAVERIVPGTMATVYVAVDRLVEVGILREVTGRKRNRIWVADDVFGELDELDRRIERRMRTTPGA